MQMGTIMKDTGRMTRRKDGEFISISKVHDMKVIGRTINKMVKVLKLGLTDQNLLELTKTA